MNKLTESHSEEQKRPLVTVDAAVNQVMEAAGEQIAQLDAAKFSYSPQAFELLKKMVGAFIADLADESIREAKRQNADTVSRSNVERASEHLVAGSGKKKAQYLGMIGGLLLGAAISQLLSMFSTPVDKWSFATVAAMLVFGIVGASLISYQIARG